MIDFPIANEVERGCGERIPGGCYLLCGLSNRGLPFPHFFIDPPQPIPPGLDLRNKTTLLERVDAEGNKVTNALGEPIWDAYIWVGEEHYQFWPYFVEEARRHGVSRRIPETMDTSRLTKASRMVFAHRRVILPTWRDLTLPAECEKNSICSTICLCGQGIKAHDLAWFGEFGKHLMEQQKQGPCVSKLWELLPIDDATPMSLPDFDDPDNSRVLYIRTLTEATAFSFCPTGEEIPNEAYQPGFAMWTPITGVALIKRADGSVNEKGLAHLEEGVERHGEAALPWYEADK